MGYGIIIKNFGKPPDIVDKNKKLMEEKRELLKKQFEEKSKELTKNNEIIEVDNKEDSNNDKIQINKHAEQLKILKNQMKVLKVEKTLAITKSKKLEKKILSYANTNKKLNDDININKTNLVNLKEKYDDIKLQYYILQKVHKDLSKEYYKYKRQIGQQNMLRKLSEKLELLSVSNRDLRTQLGGKTEIISTLIKDVDSLRINKLDGYSNLYKQQIESLENDKYSLSVENQNLRKKLEIYEPTEKVKEIVVDTTKENKLSIKSDNPRHVLVKIKESMGMLKNNDDKYIYIDYNGNTFDNVNASKYYIEDLEEVFCVAEFNDENNEYVITNIYPYIESKEELISHLYEMNLRKDNKLKVIRTGNIKKEYINYENFNNQKVLIINSFNQKLYISELKKYNLKVSGFDTYSESPLKIISKLVSYDVVICCTGTSRHYINTLIENAKDYYVNNEVRNEKYQFMEHVTISNLLNRINYAIENTK
jgi:hypothetical protein